MAVTAKKNRTKRLKLQVEHTIYGPGELIERKITDSNRPILVAHFADGTRSLLADAKFWITPMAKLSAIPVISPTGEPDEPEAELVKDDETSELIVTKPYRQRDEVECDHQEIDDQVEIIA
jgi:hypothetical protein